MSEQDESELDRGVTEIVCQDCGTAPRLKSLNKNRGTQTMCDCDDAGKSLDAVPYELGVPDLPDAWEVQGDDGTARGRELLTDGGIDQSESEVDRLMLHHGERGPVELEIWHEDVEEATHIISQYAQKGSQSEDITEKLHRAGYKLVEVDDA